MDNIIRLFVVKVAGQTIAATKEMLEASAIEQKDEVSFEDSVKAFFGGEGTWHAVTVKENWTGKDDLEVKQSIRRWDNNLRQYVVDDLRYTAALVSKAVKEWTFENCPISIDGFLSLSPMVGDVLFGEVNRRLYPSMVDHPNYSTGSGA